MMFRKKEVFGIIYVYDENGDGNRVTSGSFTLYKKGDRKSYEFTSTISGGRETSYPVLIYVKAWESGAISDNAILDRCVNSPKPKNNVVPLKAVK